MLPGFVIARLKINYNSCVKFVGGLYCGVFCLWILCVDWLLEYLLDVLAVVLDISLLFSLGISC